MGLTTSTRPSPFDDDEEEPDQIDNPEAAAPMLTGGSAAGNAASIHPAYDTSRGDPLKYRGAMRQWFSSEVAGAQHAQASQDALDRVTARQQAIDQQRQAQKEAAAQKAAEKQSKKDLESTREADFRQRGVSHYTDATGTIQPDKNEDGSIKFTPKTGEMQYDDKGHAFRDIRDSHGNVTKDYPDKDAKIGVQPARMNDLYRENQNSGWDYLGTADQAAQSQDPAIKAAGVQAQEKIKKHLHGAAQQGFKTLEDGVSADEVQQMRAYNDPKTGAGALDAEIARLTPLAQQSEGGIFGIGKHTTPAAQQAKAQLDTLTAQRGQMTMPNPQDFEKKRAMVKTQAQAFDFAVRTKGFETAESDMRQRLTAAGQDPDSDPVLKEIARARAEAGLPASDTKKKPTDDEALRAHPVFGPLLAQQDALKGEMQQGNAAVQKVASDYDAKLAPIRAQIDQGQAQVGELNAQAETHRQQIGKALGEEIKPGDDISAKLSNLSPADLAKVSPILQSLSPVVSEANRVAQSVSPLVDQHNALLQERDAAVQAKADEVSAVTKPKADALNDKWKAANDQERVAKLPQAAEAATAIERQLGQMAPDDPKRHDGEQQLQDIQENYSGADFDALKAKQGDQWKTADDVSSLNAQIADMKAQGSDKQPGFVSSAINALRAGESIDAIDRSNQADKEDTQNHALYAATVAKRDAMLAKLPPDERQSIEQKTAMISRDKAMSAADEHVQNAIKAAGGYQGLKAVSRGAVVGGAFWAGSLPGAGVGAGIAAAIPVLGETGAAEIVGGILGGLATGSIAAAKARKALDEIGKYSDTINSFNASAEQHPYLNEAGELAGMSVGAPGSIKNLVKLGKVAIEDGGKMAAAKAIGTRVGIAGASGAGFELAVRPAFDAAAHAMGLQSEDVQAPTVKSVLTNAALGIILAGHGIEFRKWAPEDIGSVLSRAKVRTVAGIPLDANVPPDQMAAVLQKQGFAGDSQQFNEAVKALSAPLTPDEIRLHSKLKDKVAAMEASGLFKDATGVKFGPVTEATWQPAQGWGGIFKTERKPFYSSEIKPVHGDAGPEAPGLGPPSGPSDTGPNAPSGPTPEEGALDQAHEDQKRDIAGFEGDRQSTPANLVAQAFTHAPSDNARALGAIDTGSLKQHLDAIDHRIGDLTTQMAAASYNASGGPVDRQARNAIADELTQAHRERQSMIDIARRSKSTSDASDQIDRLETNPAMQGAPEDQIETTKIAIRALLKIATGQPMDALTSEEQWALEGPRHDGSQLPRVEIVKGQPVITQGAIDKLEALIPAAKGLIRQSEAERRQAVLTQANAPKVATTEKDTGAKKPANESAKINNDPLRALDPVENRRAIVLSTALRNQGATPDLADRFAHGWVSQTPEGKGAAEPIEQQRAAMMDAFRKAGGALKSDGPHPNPAEANEQVLAELRQKDAAHEQKLAAARPVKALGTYEVQVEGESEPRTVQAASEQDAKAMVAVDPKTKGFVRDAVLVSATEPKPKAPAKPTAPEPAADPEEEALFQAAKADIEKQRGKSLPPKSAEALRGVIRKVIANVKPALQRWDAAFSAIGWQVETQQSGGMGYDPKSGKLVLSLADISREWSNYERGFAEHGATEEAIHAVSEKLHDEGKIDLDAIWSECPESIKAHVRVAYPVGDDYQHSREFWRMYIQGHLNLGPEGWSIDGKPIVTEQVSPTFLQRIREALAALFKVFSDMRKALMEAGASSEYVDEVERARGVTLDRLQEIDAYHEKQVVESPPNQSSEENGPVATPAEPEVSTGPAPVGQASGPADAEQSGADGGVPAGPVGGVQPPGGRGGTDRGDTGERRELGDSVEWSGERVALAGEWRSKNPRGSEVFRGKWALVPLRLLQTNTQHGGAQDRIDRERTGAAQRLEIINNLTPENVGIAWGESPSLSDGAPITTPEGSVEVGNNRTLALRDMAENHPDKAALYDQWARDEAQRLGLDGQAHAGEPVALVRVDDGSRGGLSQREFVSASNTAGTEQRSIAETALADRGMFANSGILDTLDPREDGSFNPEFLRAFYNAAGAPKELRFEDGTPDDGKIERRAQAALLAHLLGTQPGVDRVLTSLMDNIATPGIRQVVSALSKAGPALLNAEAINPALSITTNVGRALAALLDFRRAKDAGEVRTVEDYRGQRSLFAGDERLPEVLDAKILDLFASAKSVKAVSDRFLRYSKAVQDFGHPDQGRFFQDEPPNPTDFIGTQPQNDSEREMLWNVSGRDATHEKDGGTVQQWAKIYRKLFAIERAGEPLSVGQRAMMDRAEKALGQRLLFGDEVRGTAPLENFRLEGETQTVPPKRRDEQQMLFAQPTANRDPIASERFARQLEEAHARGDTETVEEMLMRHRGDYREYRAARDAGPVRVLAGYVRSRGIPPEIGAYRLNEQEARPQIDWDGRQIEGLNEHDRQILSVRTAADVANNAEELFPAVQALRLGEAQEFIYQFDPADPATWTHAGHHDEAVSLPNEMEEMQGMTPAEVQEEYGKSPAVSALMHSKAIEAIQARINARLKEAKSRVASAREELSDALRDVRDQQKAIKARYPGFSASDFDDLDQLSEEAKPMLRTQRQTDPNQLSFGIDQFGVQTEEKQAGLFGGQNAKEQEPTTQEPKPATPPVEDSPADTLDGPQPVAAQETPQIADFGEKIGGARKDTAKKLGPRGKVPTSESEMPGWRRKYIAMQELAWGGYGKPTRATGKWIVARTDGVRVRSATFASEQEAEAAIPLTEVSRNHAVRAEKGNGPNGLTWAIQRKVGEHKYPVVKRGFDTEEDAMRYMATHPEEIIEHKFAFPERPWLDRLQRIGGTPRTGDVTPAMFQDTFGFRGGEFGNWNMGGDGQAALNHAYDALADFAEILGVKPKALSLNGELAIAFGARGTGGENAAAAHYEPGYRVINLTKIKGAGSLAHEWFHALDHYLGRQDGKGGGRVEAAKASGRDDAYVRSEYVSHGFSYKSGVREALREAFKAAMDAATATTIERAVPSDELGKVVERQNQYVHETLQDLKNSFLTHGTYREKKPPTAEQVTEFDRIAAQIAKGDVGEKVYVEAKGSSRFSMGRESFAPIEELNALYKKVIGRSFATKDEGSLGKRLFWQIRSMQDAQARVANAGEVKDVRKAATDFLREARKIDNYRASNYWSTPHEMGARAFESFVSDKLDASERKNQYLVHGADNKFYRLLDMKPYPEGEERPAINAAWQKVWDTIEQHDSEGGGVMLKTQPLTGVLTGVDPLQDAEYSDDREQHRRNLRRAIESAQSDARGSGSAGEAVRDYAAQIQRLVSRSEARELDPGPIRDAIASGRLGKNLGRNEHEVRLDDASGRVVKFTKEGEFGPRTNFVGYLKRLETNNRFLDDDLRFEGVLKNPETGGYRVVVSQPFIKGTPATKQNIEAYFKAKGFERFTDRAWWHPVHEVLIQDAESHNIIMGEDGKVYPIDVIPETDPSPRRVQQIEMGVEGWKQQAESLRTQPQTPLDFGAHGLELFDRMNPQQQATALALADKLKTYPDHEAAKAAPEPTPAQKEAGNYQMGHTRIAGLDISIENAAGSIRSGEDGSGKKWSVVLGTHYGYIRGTEGKDGDHVDVMIKPGLPEDWAGTVYVVNQPRANGRFDEHKAVFGAASEADARHLYLSNYSPGWKVGPIAAMSMPEFKEWLANGEMTKPAKASDQWVSDGTPHELIQANLHRADAIAAGFDNIPGVEHDDVRQVARIGLTKAAQSYSKESGREFGPYAGTAIRNELRTFYTKRIGDRNQPTLDEPIASHDGSGDETGTTRLVDQSADVERDAARNDSNRVLDEVIADLPDRLRSIAEGLLRGETQEEISVKMGISPQAVGNTARIAITRLRQKLQARGIRNSGDMLLKLQPQTEGESSDDPMGDLMRLLNSDEIDPLSAKAAAEMPGEFKTGRPDLAIGARGPDVRAVDEWMKSAYTPETREQWRKDAEAMLAQDYSGTVDRLASAALAGKAHNPADTIASQMIIDRELALPQTPERARRIQALTLAHRLSGRAAGRALAARVDMEQSPETRNRLFLNDVVNGTKPAIVRQIAEAKTGDEAQRLIDQARRESDRIKDELRKQGVSIDDLLAGEVTLRLKGAPIVQNIVASFDEKRQKAFALLQGGTKTFDEVAKEANLTPKEVEAVRDEFVAEFRRKHFEKFQKGLKAEQLDSPTLKAQPQEVGNIADAAAEAEFQRALRMMGIVPKTDQGKFKVVKRRKRPRTTSAPVFEGQTPSFGPAGEMPNRQGDLLNPTRNADRAPTGATPMGEARSRQGDLINPERNADRSPTGAIPMGVAATKQGDLLNPERNADRAPTGAVPIDSRTGKQSKLDLPFEEWMFHKELSDPVQIMRISGMAQAASGNGLDMAYEYWINNILSGPATHVANIAGNAASMAWDFSVQRGLEAMTNLVYRDANSAQFGEFKHLLRGILPGLARGFSLAGKAWNAEADLFKSSVLDQQVELFDQFEKGGGAKPAIPGKTGRVVRMPGRALLYMDSLFKGLIGQMEAGAQGYRMAKQEGLKGDKLEARIRELINTPNSEAWQRAVEKAIDLTFQQPSAVGKLTGYVKSMKDDPSIGMQAVGRIFSLVMPFVNTPWNIFKMGLRKTPLGSLNMLARFSHAGFMRLKNGKGFSSSYSEGEQVKHFAEQIIAWATMAALWSACQGDPDDDDKQWLITGSVPETETSKGERALQDRAFGGSYMLRIGGRKGVSFNYGRYEPAATVIGTMVDSIRSLKRKTPTSEQLDAMWGYFVAQAQAKTFLQGQADMIKTLQDGKGTSDKFKRGILQAIVPNLIRQPLRNWDEWQRDSKGADLKYQIVPLGENAPQKIDAYGAPVRKEGNPISRLFFAVGTETSPALKNADALLLHWNAANPTEKYAPAPPDRHYLKAGKHVEMTGTEYEKFLRSSGQKVQAHLAGRIGAYQIDHPTLADVKIIRGAFEKAHEEAKAEMFPKGGQSVKDMLWH